MSEKNHRTPLSGQADPLDRGSGKGASGGGLANADFVPKHDSGSLDRDDDDSANEPDPRIVDDELAKPPEQRSPLS